MNKVYFVVALLFASSTVMAQSSGVSSGESKTNLELSNIFANPKMIAGIKSYNDSGRLEAIQSKAKRDFKSSNEFFVGFTSAAGWGMYGQIVEKNEVYGSKSSSVDRTIPGDWSLSVTHPIYKNENLSLTGMAREYFPVTDHSTRRGVYQKAYYLNLNYKMANQFNLFSQLIPRYFPALIYDANSTVFLLESRSTISRPMTNWLRVGVGELALLDSHKQTATGKSLEIYPYADFLLSNNIFAGPRVYLPVAIQNQVFEGPTAASLNNAYFELYMQATL